MIANILFALLADLCKSFALCIRHLFSHNEKYNPTASVKTIMLTDSVGLLKQYIKISFRSKSFYSEMQAPFLIF